MKNKYEVHGDIATIFLQRRNGETLETVIDVADLHLANSFRGTWYATNDSRHKGDYYAVIKIHRKRCYLARVLLNAPKGLVVDHKNHNTLDNRRANIRLATIAENGQNRKLDKDSTTGIRGVYYDKHANRWRVEVEVRGKRYRKRCKTIEEAEILSIQIRKDNMPFSQEAMGM